MLLVNYGVHSTLWGGTQYLSADFPGEAMRFVEERSKREKYEARREDTVALFIQRCCGDVSPAWPGLSPNWPGRPIYSRNDYESVVQLGKYLANQIQAAVDSEGAKLEGADNG
jgi:hypothetical protein